MLEVQLTTVDDKSRVLVRFQAAAELAEIDKAIAAETARAQAAADKPLPVLKVKLPTEAANVEATASRIEFTVAIGKGRSVLQSLRKQLVDAGWKAEDTELGDEFGEISLKKDGNSISLGYVESGVLAPDITIHATGMKLERAK
jgi:hypothetical protein